MLLLRRHTYRVAEVLCFVEVADVYYSLSFVYYQLNDAAARYLLTSIEIEHELRSFYFILSRKNPVRYQSVDCTAPVPVEGF